MAYPAQPNDVNGFPFLGLLASKLGVNKFVALRGIIQPQQHGEDVADLAVQDTVAQGKLDIVAGHLDGLEGNTAAIGATTDPVASSNTGVHTFISLFKRFLNVMLPPALGRAVASSSFAVAIDSETKTVLDSLLAVFGATSGAKVITDAAGTAQQYLRGLVHIFANVWDSTKGVLKVRTAQQTRVLATYSSTIPVNSRETGGTNPAITVLDTTTLTVVRFLSLLTDSENYIRMKIAFRNADGTHTTWVPQKGTIGGTTATRWYPIAVRDGAPSLIEVVTDTQTGTDAGGFKTGTFIMQTKIELPPAPYGLRILLENVSATLVYSADIAVLGYQDV